MPKTPDSWLTVTLGEVVEYGRVTTVQPQDMTPSALLIELEDIERDTSRITAVRTVEERNPKSSKNKFKSGQILYGKLRPYLNKVIKADQDGYCSTEIIPISAGLIDRDFLFFSLKSPAFLDYVKEASHGMGMPRLGTPKAKAAPFTLPPLSEQIYISKKLENLVKKIDSIRSKIDAIPLKIKCFRQSVFTAAASGRLTENWSNTEHSPWPLRKAIDVCEKVQSGGTPKNGFSPTGIPFLKVYNIVDQKISFDYKPQFIEHSVHKSSASKSITLPGDVIMNIVGPPLGKIAIIPNTYPEWNINQAIVLFRPSNEISSGWLNIILEGGENLKNIMHDTKGSAGQINISLSQCRNFLFPVPPIEVQNEIVRRTEKLLAFADQIEEKISDARENIDHLLHSIFTRAFSGELTSDWRAKNPDLISGKNSAVSLLERIEAGRKPLTQRSTPKKSGKKSMKAKFLSDQPRTVVDALKESGGPLSGQQLLSAAGYPTDASVEQIEQFFLDIRAALNSEKIVKQYRDGDGQDWFALTAKK
ncbi:restriction endonuclease subunit S [Pseudomonas sp. NyZ201]|uniref:restriction endonuclease subunit S n=1 Tax=Pseudomonas sp. NyZ201 TaxID=3409857 RepID=UPI003CE8AE2C